MPPSARFIVAVAFLIERDGRLLMIRRGPDREHAPGEWECGSGREEAIGIAFHCRMLGGELRLSNEHDAVEWVPLDRVATIPVSQPLRDCLTRFVRRAGT